MSFDIVWDLGFEGLRRERIPSFMPRITPLSPLILKRGILNIVSLSLNTTLKIKSPSLNIPLMIRGIKGVMNVPKLPL